MSDSMFALTLHSAQEPYYCIRQISVIRLDSMSHCASVSKQ